MKGSELNMKYSQEEILKALHIIKEVCEQCNADNEDLCPFCRDDECVINADIPSEWKINDDSITVWKGLL